MCIRDRVAYCHDLETLFHQQFNDSSRCLALAASCADSSDSNDRLGAFHHGLSPSEEYEIGSCGVDNGTHRHHPLVWDIAVCEDTINNFKIFNQLRQIIL